MVSLPYPRTAPYPLHFLLQLMEIQKRMFPNLSNFAIQIGSFVVVTNLMAVRERVRDPARCIKVGVPSADVRIRASAARER